MIILGIDPGTATTGYGVIKIKPQKSRLANTTRITWTVEYLDDGIIVTDARQPVEQRLKKLHLGMSRIIKEYQPDVLVVEKLFFYKNLKTALPVSEARGIILLAAAQNKIEIKQYTPLEIKMTICGYGRADKKQVQRMVKEILKLKEIPKPDDAADALAVAACYFFATKNHC